MRTLRAAVVQFQSCNGDKPANLRKIREFVEEARRQRVELISFPECCISGYWFLRKLPRPQIEAIAEPVFDGPSSQALMELSQSSGMTIGAGLVERDGDRLYNTYVVAMPDGQLRRHRKLHAFVSEFLSDGTQYTVFDTPHGWRVGVLICYDNNIIENVRITALMGADVLLAPHQTGGCDSRGRHAMRPIDLRLWENRHADPAAIEAAFRGDSGRGWIMRWLPSRAHDNGLFLLFANGVGRDDNEVRTGNAMILDPYGRTIVETCAPEDKMLIADLDPELFDHCTGRRWITTRRPDLYRPLTVPTGRERSTRVSRFE